MKKKILSSLLFAALVGGAVSTFTACKDYDDDINSLQTKVDQLEALKAVKADVDAEITSLKSQLEQANSKINKNVSDIAALETRIAALETAKTKLQEAIDKKADKTWVEANYATISYVDGLYANIIAAGGEKLGDKMKGLLENEYEALKAGAWTNLKLQLEALEKAASMEPDAEGKYAPIVQAIKDLQAITKDYDVTKYGTLKELAEKMNTLSTNLTEIDKKINILTVLCGQQLRSLVFQPQAYYWGVEATRLFTLDGVKWNTKATAWNKFETGDQTYNSVVDYGYKKYNRYGNEPFFKVLDFVATYHMNPSTANFDSKNPKHSVSVVSDDKEFLTRSAEAGLTVKNWNTANGDLIVNLAVANKNLIKEVGDHDGQLTVFAAQAHMGDTTVTSDYATIVKRNISDVKIYHKVADATKAAGQYGTYTQAQTVHPITGVAIPAGKGLVNHNAANNAIACPNAPAEATGVPEWNEEINEGAAKTRGVTALTPSTTLGPVLGTVKQSVDYFTQDWVLYNCNGFDLKELVCVRVWDGTAPIEVNPADLGLHYKFELTALHLLDGAMVGDDGPAKTSESAHAAIQGDTFRPQMVEEGTGNQTAFGSAQGKQTIGRTPVVRVSLVDDEDNVYDYGYIRLLIVDENTEVPSDDLTVEYTGNSWSYGHECNPAGWIWNNTWAQVEYDLYSLVGLTRPEFVEVYKSPTVVDVNGDLTDAPELLPGSTTEFQQYVKKDGKFVKSTAPVGHIYQESGIAADGTETSTLKWTVTGQEALANFKANSVPEVAVRYVSRVAKYPDIYVVVKPGTITIYDAPVANISWDALKNPSYWYANNSNVSATTGGTAIENATEMHNNVLTPEDNTNATVLSKNFRQTVSATMLNNMISGAKLFVDWATAPADQAKNDYKAGDFAADLVFSTQNNGKEYIGESGVTYKMIVKNSGKSLEAYKTTEVAANSKPVAQIVGSKVNEQQIVYGGNTAVTVPSATPFDYKDYGEWAYAKDLLNYKAHNALDDNTIRAIVGVKLTNKCEMEVKHNDATFDVRFLRPINVTNAAKEIEDANTTQLQTIDVEKLVSFTDWREAWKSTYVGYYGIKSVSIDGVTTTGAKLSDNADVKTNQSGEEKALKDVNAAIDFIYTAPAAGSIAGTLTYKNFSSTVDEFYVKIPLTVEYFWGKIHTTATITVKRTAHNAPGK